MFEKIRNFKFESIINIGKQFYFWVFNIFFVLVGIPFVAWGPKLERVLDGTLPRESLIFYSLAFITVCLSIVIGFSDFPKNTKRLFEFFILVEIPILSVAFIGLVLNGIAISVYFFLGCFLIAAFFCLNKIISKKKLNQSIENIAASIFLICGIWIGLMILIFILPSLFESISLVGKIGLSMDSILTSPYLLYLILAFSLIFFITFSIYLIPAFYFYFSFKTWKQTLAQEQLKNKLRLSLIRFSTILLVLISFHFMNKQSHGKFIAELQNSKTHSKKEYYRSHLLNIYLANYSYLMDRHKNDFVQKYYFSRVGVPYAYTSWIQNIFNILFSPFLYEGSPEGLVSDQKTAEFYFNTIFQESIKNQERVTNLTDIRPSFLENNELYW